jgi:hypothetical protein
MVSGRKGIIFIPVFTDIFNVVTRFRGGVGGPIWEYLSEPSI